MRTTCLASLLLVMVLSGCQSLMDGDMVDDQMNRPHAMIFLDQARECPIYVRDINNQGTGNPAPRCEVTDGTGVQRSDAICREADKTEQITWRVAGGSNQSFTIDFKNGGQPAGWNCNGGNNEFTCEIGANETRGSTYEYSVTLGKKCVLDPVIIFH